MAIIRWRPFQDLEDLFERKNMDYGLDLAVDISEDEENIYVEMNVPGIEADNIDVEVENHHVRISGSREEKEEVEDKNYYRKEIRRGEFERIISLPVDVDKDNINAEVEDGVLKLALGKRRGSTPNKVKVVKK